MAVSLYKIIGIERERRLKVGYKGEMGGIIVGVESSICGKTEG